MEKEYGALCKKYPLPKFEELEIEFSISSIEGESQLLREICKKINERIEYFSIILEEILSPERLGSLHESSMFTDEGKKRVLRIYRNLQYLHRKSTLLELSYNEQEAATHIKKIYEQWTQEIKGELKTILETIKESWNSDKKGKLELSYFG